MHEKLEHENFRLQAALIVAVIFVDVVITYMLAPPNAKLFRFSSFLTHLVVGMLVWLIWALPGVMGRTSLWLVKAGEVFAEGIKTREGVLCRVPQKRSIGVMATLVLAFVIFIVTIALAVMIL
ncbi:MAG: hypothetical protein AB1476_05985 [Candidatus Hadarchaeota archaeon]